MFIQYQQGGEAGVLPWWEDQQSLKSSESTISNNTIVIKVKCRLVPNKNKNDLLFNVLQQ